MSGKSILEIAREAEKNARELRTMMTHLDLTQQGEIQTIRYCGALLSLASSTLCELHEKLNPVFAKDTFNGILREWGVEEIL